MSAYLSVSGESSSERVIEKSRFITYCKHIESEEEAKAYLSELHALHPLATHICYAYICDKVGNFIRFSDDGEPQGTAGMPILGVLKAKKLFETLVAVVRYFGGIKLGAGGLTRAYSSCAAEGCEAADKRTYTTGVEITLEVDYAEVNAALRLLAGEIILNRDFGANAVFTVIVRETEVRDFSARAKDFLNGKVSLTEGKKYFYPF